MLKVYLAVWCPHCRMTEKFLLENGVEYLAVFIEKVTEDVVKQVTAVNGGEDWVVPTLEYRGKWRPGKEFDPAGLKSDLIEMGVIR
jgi:mycoredoxin